MAGDNPQLSRHARHLSLAQVGNDGQRRIEQGSVLLIGVGGIGCAAASYLAASGVGNLLLCDFDTVDVTNLGRQVLYGPGDVDKLKARCAAEHLANINPDIRITPLTERLDDDELAARVSQVDVVLDCCDNFATRFQVSDACVAAARCLISGAAIRFEGQIAVFGPGYQDSPCYRCLYSDADESLENCAGNGVLGPVPGVIGTMMAVETLKHLAGIASPRGILRLYDAASGESSSVTIKKRPHCPGSDTCLLYEPALVKRDRHMRAISAVLFVSGDYRPHGGLQQRAPTAGSNRTLCGVRSSGIVTKIRPEPFLGFGQRDALTISVGLDLITIDPADCKVTRIRV